MSTERDEYITKLGLYPEIGEQSSGINPKDLIGAKKPDISLIPPSFIVGLATALEDGKKKYGAYNWREYPVQTMTYISAAMRHLLSFADGENHTTDSGVNHLLAAAASIAVIYDAILEGSFSDNRPKNSKKAVEEINKYFNREDSFAKIFLNKD